MSMPEYIRVRGYLYNLISRTEAKDLQIPSENELCQLFEVSRNTARGAIRGLVKDGYLIPRRGKGTYINPEIKSKLGQQRQVIGILSGDGRPSIGTYFSPYIEKCILASGLRYEHFYLPDSGNVKTFMESVKAGLDGLIWIGPVKSASRYLKALSESDTPTLVLQFEEIVDANECDEIRSNPIKRGLEIAEFLYPMGHCRMFFVHDFPRTALKEVLSTTSTHHAYCSRMKDLSGAEKHKTEVLSIFEFEKLLMRKDAGLQDFTVIYSLAELAPRILDKLKSAGKSIPEDISYLAYGESDSYFFNGLQAGSISINGKICSDILEWLDLRILKGFKQEKFSRELPMSISSGQSIRNLRKG